VNLAPVFEASIPFAFVVGVTSIDVGEGHDGDVGGHDQGARVP
jgi:hypothetical protein